MTEARSRGQREARRGQADQLQFSLKLYEYRIKEKFFFHVDNNQVSDSSIRLKSFLVGMYEYLTKNNFFLFDKYIFHARIEIALIELMFPGLYSFFFIAHLSPIFHFLYTNLRQILAFSKYQK
jgi:hypothetical protein